MKLKKIDIKLGKEKEKAAKMVHEVLWTHNISFNTHCSTRQMFVTKKATILKLSILYIVHHAVQTKFLRRNTQDRYYKDDLEGAVLEESVLALAAFEWSR